MLWDYLKIVSYAEDTTQSGDSQDTDNAADELKNIDMFYIRDYSEENTVGDWNALADYLNQLQAHRLLGEIHESGNCSNRIDYCFADKSIRFYDNIMEINWWKDDLRSISGNDPEECKVYYYITDNEWKNLIPATEQED